MDFPIKNGGSFHCYVSSPEGKYYYISMVCILISGIIPVLLWHRTLKVIHKFWLNHTRLLQDGRFTTWSYFVFTLGWKGSNQSAQKTWQDQRNWSWISATPSGWPFQANKAAQMASLNIIGWNHSEMLFRTRTLWNSTAVGQVDSPNSSSAQNWKKIEDISSKVHFN